MSTDVHAREPSGPFAHVPATFPDGTAPKRGISHLVALALVVMDLDLVRRSTIAALCPTNASKDGESKTNPRQQVKRAFKNFDSAGWVRREGVLFVRMLDADALFGWVEMAVDVNSTRAMTLLNVASAAKAVATSPIATLGAEELAVRERELQALERLMRQAPGVITNARGRRRLTHKPSSLIALDPT